jgi:8-oxo-dGTP pyrophosphatase MutT (NUDIX family)
MSEMSSPRPRRPPVRPGFDPAKQPASPADAGLLPVAAAELTPHALRARLSSHAAWRVDLPGDNDTRYPGREGPPVYAAVLVPMVARADGVSMLLTRRATHLHDHAGQISFPGGRIETTDASPIDAALREAEEEIGLPRQWVEVLGCMPTYATATGFSITPVVSLVAPGFTLVPDESEVAEIFEVPLAFLMNPSNHRLYSVDLPEGRRRQYYGMPWGDYFIWGATAGMLRNLYHLLAPVVQGGGHPSAGDPGTGHPDAADSTPGQPVIAAKC